MAVVKTNNTDSLAYRVGEGIVESMGAFTGDYEESAGEYLFNLADRILEGAAGDTTYDEDDGGQYSNTYAESNTSRSITDKLVDGPLDLSVDSWKEVATLTGKTTDEVFAATTGKFTFDESWSSDQPGTAYKGSEKSSVQATFSEAFELADTSLTLKAISQDSSGSSTNDYDSDKWSEAFKFTGLMTFDKELGFQNATINNLSGSYSDQHTELEYDFKNSESGSLSLNSKAGVTVGLDEYGNFVLGGTIDSLTAKATDKWSSVDNGNNVSGSTEESYSSALDATAVQALEDFLNNWDAEAFAAALLAGNDTITISGTGQEAGGYVRAGAGNDTVKGAAGNDFIDGDAGDDTLTGGGGHDEMDGGDGNDTLKGENGNDYLSGEAGDDSLNGGNGFDYLYGGEGNDTLDGGAGRDVLYGHTGNDTLLGGMGNDKLYGQDGNDTLKGGAGNDWLSGGTGKDTLTGEAGRDAFMVTSSYSAAGSVDTVDKVTDFKVKDDVIAFDSYYGDTILPAAAISVLTTAQASYAELLTAANTEFAGNAEAAIVAGKVGNDTFVFFDENGDNTADTAIQLVGVTVTANNLSVYNTMGYGYSEAA